MFRAFLAALGTACIALFLSAVLTAAVTQKMAARQAGSGLLVAGLVDAMLVVLAVWLYRTLAQAWGGAPAPGWSVLLLAVLALVAGVAMFFMTMVLLNR